MAIEVVTVEGVDFVQVMYEDGSRTVFEAVAGNPNYDALVASGDLPVKKK